MGGPGHRSLFFLRNIKVSEPPESRKLVKMGHFIKFHEISWTFRKFHDFAELSHFREISPFLVFWSVLSPPGELENLNIPIGITRF